MTEGHDSSSVLRDISLLYELSLSVGASLELAPCCEVFLRTLMERKAFDFASVWVLGSQVRPERSAYELHLVHSSPEFRARERCLPRSHPLNRVLRDESVLSLSDSDPRFAEFVTEREVESGCFALFPLSDFGLLKLYATDPRRVFSQRETSQLRNVVDKFAVALEGCLSHDHLRWEVQERMRARRQLEASEARYRALYADNPAMYFTLDERDRIVSVNAFGASQLGFTVDELLGQYALGLVHELDRVAAADQLERCRRTPGEVVRSSLRRLRRDGSSVWTEDLARALPDSAGTLRTLIVCQDVSERKRLEQQIQHAQKLESLGVLAGGVAHDFNNLLTGILGNAGVAREELAQDHELQECLESIERASHHAAELCDHLLAYAGKGQLKVGTLSLDAVLTEMRPLLEVSISKKAALELQLADGLAGIDGDAAQIRQIVINLVTNASDALGEGPGSICVSTGQGRFETEYFHAGSLGEPPPSGDYVYVEVRDTGAGMDEVTQARIFDPFFTTKFTGRGLGLAAVEGIVRSHQGAVTIVSAPGAGTTFRVFFPRVTQRAPEPPPGPVRDANWRGAGRLLVIDDEEVVRRVLATILRRAGFDVVTANDGRDGVDTFAEHGGRFDVVLLDLTMPNLDGEEALLELNRIRPDVPVILCSGFSGDGVVERLRGQGAAGFLKKPFRSADVLDLISATLESEQSE